jgi:hypothetical protein
MEKPVGCPTFDLDFQHIEALAAADVSTAQHLENTLRSIYKAYFEIDFTKYDLDGLRNMGPETLNRAYRLRTSLRDRIADWTNRGLMTREAQGGLRDVFRASRYATDMLGEMLIGYDEMDPGEEVYPAFTGPNHNTLLHGSLAGQDKVTFRSGDVLLMRGLLHNSAAIARIGDVDSQFSHISIIHIDEHGEKSVVEALIADGAVISDFNYSLEHSLARAVLYRHSDPALAAMAAHRIYERVRKSQRSWGDHIFYDFSMEPEGYEKLFCAKLVKQAYDEASHGLVKLPTFPTTFRFANKDFLARIGVTARETFAPGDMELEPQFMAVAEWRDYRKTVLIRLQDLVMVKLFQWMETGGYSFRETPAIWLVSVLGKLSGYLPNFVKWLLSRLVPKVPSNMSRKTIGAIAMLHKTAQPLLEELQEMERTRTRDTGRPLHPKEIYAHLDSVEERSNGRIGYLRRRS